MKAIELLKIGKGMMEIMSKAGIRTDDYRYIGMYEEYLKMRHEGHKYEYAIARLAKQYGISESSVSRVIRKFGKDCQSVT